MSKTFEPNAQNSELDPKIHPSGARIEGMMKRADEAGKANARNEPLVAKGQEAGRFGEPLRNSERLETEVRDESEKSPVAPHRTSPSTRES